MGLYGQGSEDFHMEARVFVFTRHPKRGNTVLFTCVFDSQLIKVQGIEEVSQVYSQYCQGALVAHPKTRSPRFFPRS